MDMTDARDKREGARRPAPYAGVLRYPEPAARDRQGPCRQYRVEEALAGVARGESRALETLYGEMKGAVYGLCLAILGDRPEAEDATQETFLKVWQSAARHRPGADGRAWVLAIARNEARQRLRSRRLSAPADLNGEPAVPEPAGQVHDRLCLRQMFSALDETERQIVVLYAVDGYLHKEIAAILGKPYATVRWKFRRAMQKLAQALPDGEDG